MTECPRCGDAIDPEPIAPEVAKGLLEQPACFHCGGYHAGVCPRIKSASWVGEAPSSTEYWPDGGWCRHNVISRDELARAST